MLFRIARLYSRRFTGANIRIFFNTNAFFDKVLLKIMNFSKLQFYQFRIRQSNGGEH